MHAHHRLLDPGHEHASQEGRGLQHTLMSAYMPDMKSELQAMFHSLSNDEAFALAHGGIYDDPSYNALDPAVRVYLFANSKQLFTRSVRNTMRKLAKAILAIFILCISSTIASAQAEANYEARIFQHLKRYKLPQSMESECDWEFALVLLNVGNDNKVKHVQVLNTVSEEFRQSFDMFKSLWFYPQDKVKGKKVMFVFSLDRDCGTRVVEALQVTPSRALMRLMKPLSEQLAREPNTIVSGGVILYDTSKPMR